VDDVVVKTRNSDTLIADLEETFASLREYRWKLNLNKCIFGKTTWLVTLPPGLYKARQGPLPLSYIRIIL
jgi:hypothetical protein